jgi:hypothetical protein
MNKGLHCCKPFVCMVAGDGIEPPTRGIFNCRVHDFPLRLFDHKAMS